MHAGRGAQIPRPAPLPEPPRPLWLRVLDVASVALCAALCLRLAASVAALPPLAWWPLLAGCAFLGLLAADFVSGLVHFACDRFGCERTPLLGPALIGPFREHHRHPGRILRHGFCEVNGNNALAVSPVLWLLAELAPRAGRSVAAAALLAGGAAFALAVALTNALHRCAHAGAARGPLRWAQRAGMVLTPRAHARHHRGAHDRAYCIATGWLNPALDGARFWERLERSLRGPAGRGLSGPPAGPAAPAPPRRPPPGCPPA
jgi:ubiquitin-conjugating enzyme E2 variant